MVNNPNAPTLGYVIIHRRMNDVYPSLGAFGCTPRWSSPESLNEWMNSPSRLSLPSWRFSLEVKEEMSVVEPGRHCLGRFDCRLLSVARKYKPNRMWVGLGYSWLSDRTMLSDLPSPVPASAPWLASETPVISTHLFQQTGWIHNRICSIACRFFFPYSIQSPQG